MTTTPHPTEAATRLWEHLVDWQPATAAALIEQLRALPDDWPLRVFGVGRPGAALELPPAAQGEQFDDQPPEVPPYAENEWEGCPACVERDRNCRFHEGYATGRQELFKPLLDAVKADKAVTVHAFLQQQADDDEGSPAAGSGS